MHLRADIIMAFDECSLMAAERPSAMEDPCDRTIRWAKTLLRMLISITEEQVFVWNCSG